MINWLENKVTENDLREMGYELELFEKDISGSDEAVAIVGYRYKIVNTDIVIEFRKKTANENAEVPIFDLWAPANLLAPEKIGAPLMAFVEDDIAYWPGESYAWGMADWQEGASKLTETQILPTTPITIILKDTYIHEETGYFDRWNYLLRSIAEKNAGIILDVPHVSVDAENKTSYLMHVVEETSVKYYKTNKKNYDTAYITELPLLPRSTEFGIIYEFVSWEEHPELFGEFISNTDSTNNDNILFRVRKSAFDENSQIGAFKNLDNAKKEADKYKSEGYAVYDSSGEMIYKP